MLGMRFLGSVMSFVLMSLCFTATATCYETLKPECRHIKILNPDVEGDTEKAVPELRYFDGNESNSNLHKVESYQMTVIVLALNTLPKFACSAVQKVAIYRKLPPPDSKGRIRIHGDTYPAETDAFVIDKFPNIINILLHAMPESELNTKRNDKPYFGEIWPIAISRIIHEAYHCAQYLLDNNEHHAIFDSIGISGDGPKFWPPDVNAAAKEIMKKTRLDNEGFTEKWQKLHADTIEKTKGPGYENKEDVIRIRVDRKAAPAPGFMTYYARRNPYEDIAETASWVVGDSAIFREAFSDKVKLWKRPCEIAKKVFKSGIPDNQAVLYSKLQFLVDVELISADDIKNCVGISSKGINKKLESLKTGFHFFNYENGQYLKSYTEGFSITRTSDGYLRVKANGKIDKDGHQLDSFLEIQFRTKDQQLPRGYYKMTWTGNIQNPGPKFAICNHLFPLKIPYDTDFAYSQQVPDDKAQSYCAIEARVLVTNATEDHIELSMVLFKVARTGPLRKTPGVFDPPVQIILRWKRNWIDKRPLVSMVTRGPTGRLNYYSLQSHMDPS